MTEVLPIGQRRGAIEATYTCAPGKNKLTVQAVFGTLPRDLIGFWFQIEQRSGADWFIVGAVDVTDLRAAIEPPRKDGSTSNTLTWNFYEQVVADSKGWSTTRDYQIDGKSYTQLAFESDIRLTFDTYLASARGERLGDADLSYSVDVFVDDKPLPAWALPDIRSG